MPTDRLLAAALIAALLPSGWGFLGPLVGRCMGACRGECWGLLLLAAAGLAPLLDLTLPSLSGSEAAPGGRPGAAELTGVWREPSGGPTFLATAAGPVLMRFAQDLPPPAPGTQLRVWVRVPADTGAALAVHVLETGPLHGAWLDRWRLAARARIRKLVSTSQRGLLESLLLGVREDLSPDLRAACVATGTLHLLALSGLHVVLVAGAVTRLPGHARRGPLLPGLVLLLFVLLAGSRPSLLRAGLGWCLLHLGERHGRRMSGLRRLAVVALVLSIASPQLVNDLGAQLSFLAVAGLLAAARLTQRGFLAPVGAVLATAPLCVSFFGRFQPWGVLVTPLLVPLVALVLLTGLVAVLPLAGLAGWDFVTGPVLRFAASALGEGLRAAAWLCPPPLQPDPLPGPPVVASLAIVAALLLLRLPRPDSRPRAR